MCKHELGNNRNKLVVRIGVTSNNIHVRDPFVFSLLPSSRPSKSPVKLDSRRRIRRTFTETTFFTGALSCYSVFEGSSQKVLDNSLLRGVSFPTRWLNVRHSTNWKRVVEAGSINEELVEYRTTDSKNRCNALAPLKPDDHAPPIIFPTFLRNFSSR